MSIISCFEAGKGRTARLTKNDHALRSISILSTFCAKHTFIEQSKLLKELKKGNRVIKEAKRFLGYGSKQPGGFLDLDWSGICRRQFETHTHVQG